MATFWIWAIRNPFGVAAGLCLLAGFGEVFEWNLALSGLAFFGIIAEAGDHLAMRARERNRQAAVVASDPAEVRSARGRYHDFVDDPHDELYDVAA